MQTIEKQRIISRNRWFWDLSKLSVFSIRFEVKSEGKKTNDFMIFMYFCVFAINHVTSFITLSWTFSVGDLDFSIRLFCQLSILLQSTIQLSTMQWSTDIHRRSVLLNDVTGSQYFSLKKLLFNTYMFWHGSDARIHSLSLQPIKSRKTSPSYKF